MHVVITRYAGMAGKIGEAAPKVFERLAAASGVRVTRVGTIIEEPVGGTARSASGESIVFTKTGWDHFSQP